jgi:Protein of unknown function (DUF4013)
VSELGASLSFPFRNPLWLRRVLAGAVLELVPLPLVLPLVLVSLGRGHRLGWSAFALLPFAALLGLVCRFLVLGYLRRTAKGVLDGTTQGLPAWDRPTEDLVEGLKLWLVAVVLWLPAVAVTVGVMLLVMAVVSPSAAWVPLVLLGVPAALATLAYFPAGLLATVADGDPLAAFDFERVAGRVARAFGPYALAFLVAIAAEIIAQLGLLICCVGIFATRFAAHCVAVHAFASALRQDASPLPAAPADGAI